MNWLWHGNKEVVFKTKAERRRGNLKKSILIFLVSAVVIVFLAVFLFMLSYDFDISNVITSPGTVVADGEKSYVIKKVKGEKNIFMYCTDDEEENVTFMCAVNFDMSKKDVTVYSVPVKGKNFNLNEKKVTPTSCYKDAGALQLVKSAEEYMGVKFDKYIGCKEGSIEGITANFAPLSINFSKKMSFTNGIDTVNFEKGLQEISDDNIVKILTYSTDDKKADEFRMEILLEMFRQYFNETTLENRDIIYSNIISQTDSNISVVDFMSYKDYIINLSSDKVKKEYIIAESVEDFRE